MNEPKQINKMSRYALSILYVCLLCPGSGYTTPLSTMNIQKIEPCRLIKTRNWKEPSLFQSPTKGRLYSVNSLYSLSSLNEICLLRMEDIFREDLGKEYRVLYTAFFCRDQSLQIVLSYEAEVYNPDVIGYAHFQNCTISMSNIGIYGMAVDLKVLTIIDCLFRAGNSSSDAEGNIYEVIPGTDNLVALNLVNSGNSLFSPPTEIFTKKWPQMAELLFEGFASNYDTMRSLKTSMPHLQAVELVNSNISNIIEFPWDSSNLALPSNLSRTNVFNDIYAGAYHIPLEPNLFRRRLIMERCNLRDLTNITFAGRFDMISLDGNRIAIINKHIFSGIETLYNLRLSSNRITHLTSGLFQNLTMLVSLDISFNMITNISEATFSGLDSLEILLLSNNYLKKIYPYTYSGLVSISTLDLSNNSIEELSDHAFGRDLPDHLEEVNLESNSLIAFPTWIFLTRRLVKILLKRNFLSFDILKRDIGKLDHTTVLFFNQESGSSVTNIFKPRREKTIDASYNNFTSLAIDGLNPLQLMKLKIVMNFFSIDLEGNMVGCDCETFSMYSFLIGERQKPLMKGYGEPRVKDFYFKSWKCSKPGNLEKIPIIDFQPDSFICPKDFAECPGPCICLKRAFDDSIIVNCTSSGLTTVPTMVPNQTDTILLSHNKIRHFGDISEVRNLKVLEVSNNQLTSLTKPELMSMSTLSKLLLHNNHFKYFPKEFQNFRNVVMSLSGNNIICDCHSKWLVRWIFSYRTMVPDINNVICSTGRPKSQVIYLADEADFVCEISKATIRAIAIAVGIILSLMIILLLVLYKFRGEIKVFLFYHFKWHPFDRTDKTDIVDKLYDAFVSYHQTDALWVMNNLRPALENETNPYRLCIHERDFKPGDVITDNIIFSVKYSRRMIMVLTKSFLQSEWCRLEFKSAHQRVLKDRTNYLIVILFDGLIIEDLDEDIKLYLKTNTYIEYNSTWFMQRLFYAMPQKPLSVLREEAFPNGGYNTLFPTPESVAIMQQIQSLHARLQKENINSKSF